MRQRIQEKDYVIGKCLKRDEGNSFEKINDDFGGKTGKNKSIFDRVEIF